MPFHAMGYNPDKVRHTLTRLINNSRGTHCFLVADGANDRPVGGLIGCIETHIFSDQPIATVIHFDVLPETRMGGYAVRLLRAFENWALKRHAVEIVFGTNSGGDYQRIGKFAARFGYECVGENWVRTLKGNRSS